MKVFSEEWVASYHLAINNNLVYAESSKKWEEGSIALVLNRSKADGIAVWLNLLKGECLESKSLTPQEAMQIATFVIEGEETTWQEVLTGRLQPLMGIMRGKLKLSKGSIARLLPYTKAATELVASAQSIPTEFD